MADDKQEPDNEFERFEDLTKQLLEVRKADLDKARQQNISHGGLLIPDEKG